MKEKTNRYLKEKLFGECWHDGITRCRKCGAYKRTSLGGYTVCPHNPDFFNWPGFGKLWEKCKEQEWWKDYMNREAMSSDLRFDDLIDPLTFPNRVREFLEGR